jgi:WD40 repeat protein/uncharacterized caspase-like protein
MASCVRLALAALVWLVLALPCLAQAGKRVALVVGNSEYKNTPRLANPRNDAGAISDLLRKAGFEVVISRNDVGNLDFKRALREFTIASRNADIALMYFAGHGLEVNRTNYLVPTDAKLVNEYDAEDEAVSLNRVIEAVQPAKRLRLIILDACRDNPLSKTMQRTIAMRNAPSGLAKVEPPTNTLIAFAAKAGSTAADGYGKHSPFTTALLNNLTKPGLDLRIALGLVRDDVVEATGSMQEPFVYGSLGGGTVSLVPEQKPAVAQTPPQPTGPSNADMHRDYQVAERIGTKAAWDYFLKTYPTGFYADMARAARDKIEQAERSNREKAAADKTAAEKAQREAAERAEAERKAAGREAAEKSREAAMRAEAERKAAAEKAAAAHKAAAEKAQREAAARAEAERKAAEQKIASAGNVFTNSGGSKTVARDSGRLTCGAAVARQDRGRGGIGGPFNPVALKINVGGIKDLRTVAISPDGAEIATAGDDGVIRIWDAASFKPLRTLQGHQGPVYSINYALGGQMASASWDGTVLLWNPGGNQPAHSFEANSPDGQPGPIKQYSVAFYPSTPLKYLASAGHDGYVRIWDLQQKMLARAQLDHKADADSPDVSVVRSLSYAPNGSGQYVTGGYDGKVRFYQTGGRRVDVKNAHARKVISVAYSPDGTKLVSAGSEGAGPSKNRASLKLWTVKGQTAKPLVGHSDYVVSAAWSPDGTRIASGGGGVDKTVRLWDAQSGKPLAALIGHTADIEAVIFDPRRQRLISVSEDKTMKVWDIAKKKELLTVAAFGERDYLAYTPEGCFTGTAGAENRLGVAEGKNVKPLSEDEKALLFVPGGFVALH